MVVDGHQFRLTADPVLTVGGDLAGAVGILSDVTDLHQAQAARRSTEECSALSWKAYGTTRSSGLTRTAA